MKVWKIFFACVVTVVVAVLFAGQAFAVNTEVAVPDVCKTKEGLQEGSASGSYSKCASWHMAHCGTNGDYKGSAACSTVASIIAGQQTSSSTGSGNNNASSAALPSGNECASILAMFCEEDDRGGQGIFDLLNLIINILTVGVGIAATAGIVISAIQYITAREKEDQAKKARTRIVEIVLGMIIWAVMWIALNFLMPGGASN